MDVLEVLNLIKDKLPDVDLEQLARDIENKKNGYSVLAISHEAGKVAEVIDFLLQFKEDDDYIMDMGGNVVAYLLKNKSKDEYRSAADFAQNLKNSFELENNLKVKIGIGEFGAGKLSAFSESISALNTGNFISDKKGVISYKEYIILKLIEDVPKENVKSHADVLFDKSTMSVFSDKDMMDTAEEFLLNSLNISETSRKLYLHRNTLLYRLDKIHEATGLDIRNFSDAMIFKVMVLLYKMNK